MEMLNIAFLCFVLGVACGMYVWMYEEWHVGNETLAHVLHVVGALCGLGFLVTLALSFGLLEAVETHLHKFSLSEFSAGCTPKTFLSVLIAIGVATHIAYLMKDSDVSTLSLIFWIIVAYLVFH